MNAISPEKSIFLQVLKLVAIYYICYDIVWNAIFFTYHVDCIHGTCRIIGSTRLPGLQWENIVFGLVGLGISIAFARFIGVDILSLFLVNEAPTRLLQIGLAVIVIACISQGTSLYFLSIMGWASIDSLKPIISKELLLVFLYSLIISVGEETFDRGVIFQLIERTKGIPFAVISSSVVFSFEHIIDANNRPSLCSALGTIIYTFAGGIVLALLYNMTRRLWASILYHSLWNMFSMVIYGDHIFRLQKLILVNPEKTPAILLPYGAFIDVGLFVGNIVVIAMILCFQRYRSNSKRNKISDSLLAVSMLSRTMPTGT